MYCAHDEMNFNFFPLFLNFIRNFYVRRFFRFLMVPSYSRYSCTRTLQCTPYSILTGLSFCDLHNKSSNGKIDNVCWFARTTTYFTNTHTRAYATATFTDIHSLVRAHTHHRTASVEHRLFPSPQMGVFVSKNGWVHVHVSVSFRFHSGHLLCARAMSQCEIPIRARVYWCLHSSVTTLYACECMSAACV